MQNITIPNAQDRVIQTLNYLMQDLGEQSGEKIVISCPLTTIEISKYLEHLERQLAAY